MKKRRLARFFVSSLFPLNVAVLSVVLAVVLSTLLSAQIREKTSYPDEGWLAADGVYSVLEPNRKDVYFLFSDTFCGTTQNHGREFLDAFMVNHSFWKRSPDGRTEYFIPSRGKNLLPDRYWLQDALFLDGKLHFSAFVPNLNDWKPLRMDWIVLSLLPDGTPDFQNARVFPNIPLLLKSPSQDFVLGAAFLEDANDGFFYCFGYVDQKNEFNRKDLIVARVKPDELTCFSAWRFWDGHDWNADLSRSAPLVPNIAAEFSVSRLPAGPQKGAFLLVNTRGGISPIVECRTAPSPVGPFSPPKIICRAPEHQNGISAYNAKAHPALSTNEYLVFSYHLNRLGSLPRTPDEYRPQFWRISYENLKYVQKAGRKSNAIRFNRKN